MTFSHRFKPSLAALSASAGYTSIKPICMTQNIVKKSLFIFIFFICFALLYATYQTDMSIKYNK